MMVLLGPGEPPPDPRHQSICRGPPAVPERTRHHRPASLHAATLRLWPLGFYGLRECKLQRAYERTPRETARQTYHVEKRFIRLIYHEAESEGVSITEVVNRVFRVYFERGR
jgi:hypothetical protein